MDLYNFRPLPETFSLKNLPEASFRAFGPAKVNPHGETIRETVGVWFTSFKNHGLSKAQAHLDQLSSIATHYFPDVDVKHLETCVAAMYWSFTVDDVAEEGDLHTRPDHVKSDLDIYLQALYKEDFSSPNPYAMMLHDIFKRIQATASPGNCKRFVQGLQVYFHSEVIEACHRLQYKVPPVSEFIPFRRRTVGAAFLWAMLEYSLDLDLPDSVFQDPAFIELDKAATDIMAWQNDLCSFNKELASDDYQNLVCCIMVEQMIELQEAIDIAMTMLESRVSEYIHLKTRLPTFGPEVDAELARYYVGIENLLQGGIVWSYLTPRYFALENLDGLAKSSMVIKLKRTKMSPA